MPNLTLSDFFFFVKLVGKKQQLVVVLICLCMVDNEDDHHFTYFLSYTVSLLAYFSNEICFLLGFFLKIYTLGINSLVWSALCVANIFVIHHFTFIYGDFW